MKCESIVAYLPGFAGGDLRPATHRSVADHLVGCPSCRSEAARYERVVHGLGTLAERELEAPPGLPFATLERIHEAPRRRLAPILPVSSAEMARVMVENKDAIASAAGAAVVVAGAAFALWRTARRRAATETAS